MNRYKLLFILLFPTIVISAQTKLNLFENAEDWHVVLMTDADPDSVFYLSEGLLNSKGDPFGYVRTSEKFENYELQLEWRWKEEATNSGVLLAITGDDDVWPHCIEAQLRDQSAGDLVLMHEGATAKVNDVLHTVNPDIRWVTVVEKFKPTAEKLHGEWNTYKIRFHDGNLQLWVNDILQMAATDVSPSKGYIGLQSEGSWIQFRNIKLTPIQ